MMEKYWWFEQIRQKGFGVAGEFLDPIKGISFPQILTKEGGVEFRLFEDHSADL
jgi:hypothetical protein